MKLLIVAHPSLMIPLTNVAKPLKPLNVYSSYSLQSASGSIIYIGCHGNNNPGAGKLATGWRNFAVTVEESRGSSQKTDEGPMEEFALADPGSADRQELQLLGFRADQNFPCSP